MDTVVYFDIAGRAEPIRQMYKHAKVEFIDKRIQKEDWAAEQKAGIEDGSLPYGQVPTVHFAAEDEWIAQSRSILQLVGERLGLAPKEPREVRRAMQLLDAAADVGMKAYMSMTMGGWYC
ncbi:hypothetical protein KIPB_013200 [Kipferlia bialata]|uniref:GST N-terminal domain-containing protein n=1 Tax=Kipferlia bialata TaxID=797122 RepID=A0A391NYF0_9EUKA|nr:hypothetical protein KIPB_013200 [Kipferlia bialata]|eukprot:g13200.t1